HVRMPIEPMEESYPEIDREVAEARGTTAKQVRKARSQLRLLIHPPPSELRAWERKGAERAEAKRKAEEELRRLADKHIPERLATGESVALLNGGLTILDNVGRLRADGLLTAAELSDLRRFAQEAYDAGIPFKAALEIPPRTVGPGVTWKLGYPWIVFRE